MTARLLGERGVTDGSGVAAAWVAARPLRVRVIIDGGSMALAFASAASAERVRGSPPLSLASRRISNSWPARSGW